MKNHIADVFSAWKKTSVGSGRTQRNGTARERRRNRLSLEMLETRQLLSTTTWNTTTAPAGGNWDLAANWSPAQVPGASDDAVINLTSSGKVFLNSGNSDSV